MAAKQNLLNFLNSRRVQKTTDSVYTHTGCAGDFKGTYYVKQEDSETFMELYNAALKKKIHLTLTEKHRDTSPIFIDFDFKQESAKRIYTAEHIKAIYTAVTREASHYVDFDEDSLTCYVLEKPAPRADKKHPFKDGFHLHFPNIVTVPTVQKIIRKNLLESGTLSEIFADVNFLNTWEDVYDSAVINKNPLLMYGSTKEGTGPAYTCAYTLWGKEAESEPCKDEPYDLTDCLSIRNKVEFESKVSADKSEEVAAFAAALTAQTDAQPTKVVRPTCNMVLLGEVEQLVAMLAPSRADARNDWRAVGSSLHSVDESLLPVWDKFSQLSAKYQPGECEKMWYDFKPGNTIRSLHYWARIDNPEQYKKYNAASMQTAMLTALSGSHYDVAQVVYSMFKFDYVSTKDDKDKTIRYKFTGHRWEVCVGGVDLRLKFSTDVYKSFMAMSKSCTKKARADSDESDDEDKDDTGDQYRKIAKRFKYQTFKNALLKESADIFYVPDKEFLNKLNESPHLIGFENGVYDLDTMGFRAGRPNDFLTCTTGYCYNTESNPKMRKEILALLRSIYDTDEMVRYMLQFGAYILHGDKKQEIMHFWVGEGGNGKGIMQTLFDKTLDNYYYAPDVSIFTGTKKSSSAPNSDIARGKGKRLWCMTQPSTDDKFNTAKLKKKSRRDRIQARDLYKSFVEYIPQFVLVVQMNNKSSLDNWDKGVVRRIRVIEHLFQFVENPTRYNERQGDEKLKSNIADNEEYWQEFMRLLIETYVHIQQHGKMADPQAVLDSTTEYMEANNVVGGFLSGFYDITNNKDDIIKAGPLYDAFKASHHYVGKNQQQFREAMIANGQKAEKITKRGSFHNNVVYRGIVLKVLAEEEEEAEVDDLG
jgi:P4 family phage/plasmid primase-like protien